MIDYSVSIDNPNNHLFSVTLKIDKPDPAGQVLHLPSWIPGSYMIRDFSRNMVSLNAHSSERKLLVRKIDKASWQVESCCGPLLVNYEIYALDLSVRSAHLDNTHAFFNGTSLFLEPVGQSQSPVTMHIHPVVLNDGQRWTVKTALTRKKVDAGGFGEYAAADYDELIDCPVEISDSLDIDFEVNEIAHYLHLSGDLPAAIDSAKLAQDLKAVCLEQAALFADELPMAKYHFLTMVVENGYGGLEHKSSTALVCSPDDLPVTSQIKQTAEYRRFLGLCSHEYFHLWNVKRIRPRVFQEQGLQTEAHTTLLWAFEGITSYYDDLALLRSATITLEDYLQLLSETLTRLYRSKGRLKQTLADSSFDAWTKFYKQDENALNAIVSYYTKGAIVALGLDVTMRLKTHNKVTLDDLMRALWDKHGKNETGVAEDDIELLATALAGQSLQSFFDLCLRSTKELPVESWLNILGIGMRLRAEKKAGDTGGYIKRDQLEQENQACQDSESVSDVTLGCNLVKGTTTIASVYNDSAAEIAGLVPGDVIVAIDNKKVTPENYDKIVTRLSLDEPVDIHVFRRDRLKSYRITPMTKLQNICELFLYDESELTAQQLQMQSSWRSTSVKA